MLDIRYVDLLRKAEAIAKGGEAVGVTGTQMEAMRTVMLYEIYKEVLGIKEMLSNDKRLQDNSGLSGPTHRIPGRIVD